ncbi:pentapeptide repeat-containing protein [Actinomadura sp. WAC 06369]|uniref:pentapeptide repeat-containing protein n=1 Tax=Actinomadura sp. WAC 06369 TaxID=2203193 RepID=UPI001F2901E0|nr:pentapeptide repeat-containing protein [Actinomadura sp. WAC 06369]
MTAAALVLWIALGPGALWVLEHADKVKANELEADKRAEALDRVRGRAVAIGTGLLALVAIVFTARTARAALASSDAAQQTAAATEQGMVTGRYTAAIEQLGSDKLDIRLGGVYALERIARDSMRDHPTVIAVLAAFAREHSHDPDAHTAPAPSTYEANDAASVRVRFRPDIQSALTVIGRRNTEHDFNPLDLRLANLTGANLTGAKLPLADLSRADLTRADMAGAILILADLTSTKLTYANLRSADLREAVLVRALTVDVHLDISVDFGNANLPGANLTDASLARANLARANLTGADLTGVDLSGANLTGAILIRTKLSGANLAGTDLRETLLTESSVRAAGAHIDERTQFGPPPV